MNDKNKFGLGFDISATLLGSTSTDPISPRTSSSPRTGLHGRKLSTTFSPTLPSMTPRHTRPFYGDRPPNKSTFISLILRPFFVLARRGPLYPLVMLIGIIIVVSTVTMSSTTQSVKRRMQGVVGPYIPERAAEAINWRSPQVKWSRETVTSEGIGTGIDEKEVPRSKIESSEPKRKDGRTIIEAGRKHPIPALMKEAKEKWAVLTAKQTTTFSGAVDEYVSRYKMKPPKGFDQWYAFARANNVLLIDEFDLINKDLALYRAFNSTGFRARLDHIVTTFNTTWTITVKDGKAARGGLLGHHDRAKGVVALLKRFVHHVPDLKMAYNGHDGARIPVAWEERNRLEELGKAGKYDDDAVAPFLVKERGPAPHWGMPIFCPPNSSVREPGFEYGWPKADSTGLELGTIPDGAVGTLIDRMDKYMDVCDSPQYRHYHSTTSWVYAQHPSAVLPLFTPGVQTKFGDIHGLIVEQLDLVQEHDPSWESRPFTSLQWRGQTSGPLWDATSPWKTTHRARIHLLSHEERGSKDIILTDKNDAVTVKNVPNYRVNPLFLDTGMVGPAVQCVIEDGTCDKMYTVFDGYDKRMSFDRASLYKYVLDIDGNSWSGRFRRLMKSNAAVVKSTIFNEFWSDWAIPWLHYIPMQVDYSDMWDIMAFFRGGLDGEGAHDALGKEIALAGQDWVDKFYRGADLEAYQFRLLLEYARLHNDEVSPGSRDFNGDVSVEPVWIAGDKARMVNLKRSGELESEVE